MPKPSFIKGKKHKVQEQLSLPTVRHKKHTNPPSGVVEGYIYMEEERSRAEYVRKTKYAQQRSGGRAGSR